MSVETIANRLMNAIDVNGYCYTNVNNGNSYRLYNFTPKQKDYIRNRIIALIKMDRKFSVSNIDDSEITCIVRDVLEGNPTTWIVNVD